MLLGEKGRILKDVRERATQILEERLERPVVFRFEVIKRRNPISLQN